MKYNDYVALKNLYKKHINESADTSEINSFIIENDIDEFISDCSLLENEHLFEAGAGAAIGSFFKKIIGKIKLKGAVKKYANEYLNYHAVDLEEAKVKKSDSWTKAEGAKKDQLEAAWKKKKEQLKTLLDASDEKLTIIGDRYEIRDLVPVYKNKAKMAGAKKVLDLSQNLLSDSAKAELQNTYNQLVIKDKKNQEILNADIKEEADNFDKIKKELEDNGFDEKTAEEVKDIDIKNNIIKQQKDKEGKVHYFVMKKSELPAEPTKSDINDGSKYTGKKKETYNKLKIEYDKLNAKLLSDEYKLKDNKATKKKIINKIKQLSTEMTTAKNKDKEAIQQKIDALQMGDQSEMQIVNKIIANLNRRIDNTKKTLAAKKEEINKLK